jgi:hypothetical protein
MIAFRINVETRKVEQIEINDWKEIAPAIGNGCTTFACPVTFDNEDSIYCDDESLLRQDDIKGGFMMDGWNYPIVGNAVIQGTDEDGDSTEPLTPINELESKIKWIDKEDALRWAIRNVG